MLLLVSNLLMVPFGIIGSISLLRSSAEAVPVYSANYCPNSTTYEVSNAAFRTNLNVLLSVLVANASQSGGFYASGTGRGTINTVDGQLLCRGDVSPTTCQECAAAAATEIKNRCPNKTESIIWYDECEVGYTNRYYVPTTIEPGVTLFDDSDVSASDLDSFNRTLFGLLERLGEEAAGSDLAQKFATGDQEFGGGGERSRVYGLAQCTPDLTAIECGECLRNATGTLPVCCGGKQGARALLVKCNVRYQLYRFYNTTTSGTSPPSGTQILSPITFFQFSSVYATIVS